MMIELLFLLPLGIGISLFCFIRWAIHGEEKAINGETIRDHLTRPYIQNMKEYRDRYREIHFQENLEEEIR